MNANRNSYRNQPTTGTLSRRCLASCQRVLSQLDHQKEAILKELRETLQAPERLFRLAMNEAEALAWQTPYPYLVFPVLAAEKAQELAAWDNRQRALLRQDLTMSFAE
jgi:hypothetical protein